MIIVFHLLFSYFTQAELYGEFILKSEIGSFAPPKATPFSLLNQKKNLLFLENSSKIILCSEGIFKPLIFDIQGNYLGYLETSFYYAQKIKYKKKELVTIPFGNVLGFYTLKNKRLSLHQKLSIKEYIISFDFLKNNDSLLIILSCCDKKQNKIKIYNQRFKLLKEKIVEEKFFIYSIFDTLILGIAKNLRKAILWNSRLKTLWKFTLKDLLITDYAVVESFLIFTTSCENQKKGVSYFLSLKDGKIFEIFSRNYFLGFRSVQVSDIDDDGVKEVLLSSSGKKGEVFILKWAKEKLILKKKLTFPPLTPFINQVNIFLLEVDDFIYDKDKNKELLLLITYEQKNTLHLPNTFISGELRLLTNKLKEISQLELNSPIKDYLIVKKYKKENVLVVLSDKLKFYE